MDTAAESLDNVIAQTPMTAQGVGAQKAPPMLMQVGQVD